MLSMTDDNVVLVQNGDDEYFVLTPKLRWDLRLGLQGYGQGILQQAWQGSRGSIRWTDVPVEAETSNE